MRLTTKILTIAALLISQTVHAHTPAQQPEVYTLTVTGQELSVLSKALGDLPYKEAAPVINGLNEQIKRQLEERSKIQQDKPQ